ncbi:TetR/AcrR family transcriptional regulator [Gammaproteobacteria bacterium]|nr:TetR/AcrR family transcriptional regulator [Gammaproteobacteria bacterium]MDB9758363.1 TetR/AcrR family transcriptional regulator [Gammaproteobacteria bacterium]MDC1423268.1 TetR/AcrR family transcriptional regulator [Gammaproteobacteria bacterium]MDC1511754.1 TetR/AcrR family transcriptional regulator [Gammaproteobacteria bacterium]
MSVVALARMPRPTKTQRIDSIVESARKVFCASGFEKGSIVDIAKDAGIAEGTIYRYFDGKRSLLDEVLRRHYAVFFDSVQQTLPSIEGHSNRLRFLIRRALQSISEDRGICGLITRDKRPFDNEPPSLSQELNQQVAVLIAQEIKAGILSGSFHPDTSPSIVCDMIGGGLELIAYSYMRTSKAIDVDKVTNSITRTFLCGIETTDPTTATLAKLVERLEKTTEKLYPS